MHLFDAIKRESTTGASDLYSAFVAANQDGSLEGQDRRDKLESWFQKFPGDGKGDLRGRFRSKNHDDHDGAFFELFMHELPTNLRCHAVVAGADSPS